VLLKGGEVTHGELLEIQSRNRGRSKKNQLEAGGKNGKCFRQGEVYAEEESYRKVRPEQWKRGYFEKKLETTTEERDERKRREG